MSGTHTVWDGSAWVEVDVPLSGDEPIMLPVLRVVVSNEAGDSIILQRRDTATESVRGLLELPGGRWRSGESPLACAMREVREETGLSLVSVDGVTIDPIDEHRHLAVIRPLVVVAGIDGGFPAVHTVITAVGSGVIAHEEGVTADVRWWRIDEVRDELARNRVGFVPSTAAALSVYAETLDSEI
jgi:8-oxo-dGTP pyrophosphatase MutT (NUDIX family)